MIDSAVERPPAEVQRIIQQTGNVLHETVSIPTVDQDGMPCRVHGYRIGCVSEQSRLDLLVELALFDAAYFPQLQLLARRICGAESTPADRVAALHSYVRGRLGYAKEPTETFLSAPLILRLGIGDCDDHVSVMLALLVAGGFEALAEQLGGHVCAAARIGASWWWCETTVAARLGEHPADAARRLGLTKHRRDLNG